MTKQQFFAAVLLLSALLTLAAGCSKMKAKPAADSGFLADSEKMAENRERAPFNRLWVDEKFDLLNYDSLFVAPVNTNFLIEQNTWAKANPRNIKIEDDTKKIAVKMREKVIDAFQSSDENRFKLVDGIPETTAAAKTMIFELALTELVPSKAILGAIGVASWAVTPAVGIPIGAVASMADDGWIAIEGRIRDGETGEIVAMFADREKAKTRILDLTSVTWYAHTSEIMGDWSQQFVTLANTPKDFKVEDSNPFRLRPW